MHALPAHRVAGVCSAGIVVVAILHLPRRTLASRARIACGARILVITWASSLRVCGHAPASCAVAIVVGAGVAIFTHQRRGHAHAIFALVARARIAVVARGLRQLREHTSDCLVASVLGAPVAVIANSRCAFALAAPTDIVCGAGVAVVARVYVVGQDTCAILGVANVVGARVHVIAGFVRPRHALAVFARIPNGTRVAVVAGGAGNVERHMLAKACVARQAIAGLARADCEADIVGTRVAVVAGCGTVAHLAGLAIVHALHVRTGNVALIGGVRDGSDRLLVGTCRASACGDRSREAQNG